MKGLIRLKDTVAQKGQQNANATTEVILKQKPGGGSSNATDCRRRTKDYGCGSFQVKK